MNKLNWLTTVALAVGALAICVVHGPAAAQSPNRGVIVTPQSQQILNLRRTLRNPQPAPSNLSRHNGTIASSTTYRTAPPAPPATSYQHARTPNAVRNTFSNFQPSNNALGVYMPWATQNPYGAAMKGNPLSRAACLLGGC